MNKELLEILEKGDLKKLRLYVFENDGEINRIYGWGDTALHFTARFGHLSLIDYLLKQGLKANDKNGRGETALHISAAYGHIELLKRFLKKGLKMEDKNNRRETVLHISAKFGHLSVVEYLLKNKANIFAKDEDGNTALHLAAKQGSVSIIELFLKKSLKIDDRNDHGDTVFHRAAMFGQLSIVEFLLEKGMKIDDKNNDGETALHIAAYHGNLSVVKCLLKRGAKAEDKTKDGNTVLRMAVRDNPFSREKDYLSVVKCLVEGGASVNDKTMSGKTELHYAALDNLQMVRLLLKNGARVNDKDNNGNTALHIAANYPKTEIIEYLLNYPSVNLNEQNNEGDTGLSFAVWHRIPELVSLFLKKGSYVDIVLNDGQTIQTIAHKRENMKCLALLKSSEELLSLALGGLNLLSQSQQIKEKLEFLGCAINGRQVKSGNTALHIAILHKQMEIVKILLEQGADVLIKNHNRESARTLLLKDYFQNHYFLSLSNVCALSLTEENLSFQKKHNLVFNPIEIKKETVERQKFEDKESKEQEKTKGSKEVSEHALFISEHEKVLDQCENYLDEIDSWLNKLTEEERNKVCFSLAKLLLNRNHCLFSPSRGYQFLSRITDVTLIENPEFSEVHKMMLELLISKSIIFEIEGRNGEPKLVSASIELDGQSTIETKEAESHRVFCIIKHILYSKTEHDGAFGKYISQYIQELGSVIGLKDVHDKSIPSQLALIKAFKQNIELSRKREQELKDKTARVKILEEKLKKREMEMKDIQDKLHRNKGQNLASNKDVSYFRR